MLKAISLLIVSFVAASAFAKTKEFCGKRDGTAGNSMLVDNKGNEIITLGVQGGDQTLIEQTDDLIGKNSGVKNETGTQNGKKYCVVAELNTAGEPVKIVKAWHKK